MPLDIRLTPNVVARIDTLGDRDLAVVSANVSSVARDPQRAGRPSFHSRAKEGAWQHVCPYSFMVLYRWGADQSHPPNAVTIEDIIDRL